MTDLLLIPRFVPCLVFFFIVLLIREFVSFRRILPAKYIFTPFVTLSVIAFALLSAGVSGIDRYTTMIVVGLLLSLVADTLLMIEEVSLMKQGLVFFLLTHVFYIAAFSQGYTLHGWHAALIPALLSFIALFFRKIRTASSGMNVMILLYMAVLCTMCFFAFSHLGPPWGRRSVLLPAGALLFVVSDCILALNAFGKKIPHSTVLTWSLYAPAQLFIALSCFH